MHPSFETLLASRFDGMIRLTDVERLQQTVAHHDGWFLLNPPGPWPDQTVSGSQAAQHLSVLVEEILKEERGVWSTMIYVHSSEDPTLIKVFHPRRAGCGCGPSAGVKPWWVFSRVPPAPVPEWQEEFTCAVSGGEKSAWWRKIL